MRVAWELAQGAPAEADRATLTGPAVSDSTKPFGAHLYLVLKQGIGFAATGVAMGLALVLVAGR
jgi:hypothetical protein